MGSNAKDRTALSRETWMPPSPNWYVVHAVDVHFGGEELVYAARDGLVVLSLSLRDGFRCRAFLRLGRGFSRPTVVGYVGGLTKSSLICVGCQDGSLYAWDTKSTKTTKISVRDDSPVTSICSSSSPGNKVYVGRSSGLVELWTVGSREGILSDTVVVSSDEVCAIAPMKGQSLEAVVADTKGGLYLICLESGGSRVHRFAEHHGEVTSLAWHPGYPQKGLQEERAWLLSAGRDYNLKIFGFSEGRSNFHVGNSVQASTAQTNVQLNPPSTIADSEVGRRWVAADWISATDEGELKIATGDGSGRILLWLVEVLPDSLNVLKKPIPFQSFHSRPIFCLRSAGSTGSFVTTSMDRTCAVWSAASSERAPLSKISTLGGFVHSMALFPQGPLAIGSGDSLIRLLGTIDGECMTNGRLNVKRSPRFPPKDKESSNIDSEPTFSHFSYNLWQGLPASCRVTCVTWGNAESGVLGFGLAGGHIGYFSGNLSGASIFSWVHRGPVKKIQWCEKQFFSLGIDGELMKHEYRESSDSDFPKVTEAIYVSSLLDGGVRKSISAFAWQEDSTCEGLNYLAVAFTDGYLRVYSNKGGVFKVTVSMQSPSNLCSICWKKAAQAGDGHWLMFACDDGSLQAALMDIEKPEIGRKGSSTTPIGMHSRPLEEGENIILDTIGHLNVVELRPHSRKHAVSSCIWLEGESLTVVAGSIDGSILVIKISPELPQGSLEKKLTIEKLCSSRGHSGPVLSLVQVGTSTFMSGGEDQCIHMWKLSRTAEMDDKLSERPDQSQTDDALSDWVEGLGSTPLLFKPAQDFNFGHISAWISDIGAKAVKVGLNAQAVSFMQLLHTESHYTSKDGGMNQNTVKAAALAYWRGDYGTALERFFTGGHITADIVNLAAGAGREVWEAATRSYASLLEESGQVQMATLQLLAIGDIEAAIGVLQRAGLDEDSHILSAVRGLAHSTPMIACNEMEKAARQLAIEGRRSDAVKEMIKASKKADSMQQFLYFVRNAAELSVRLTKESDSSKKEYISVAFQTLASFAILAENKGEVHERLERWIFNGSFPLRITLENLATMSDLLRRGVFPDVAPCSSHDAAIVVENLPKLFEHILIPGRAAAWMVHAAMLRGLGDTIGPTESEQKALSAVEEVEKGANHIPALNRMVLTKLGERGDDIGMAANAFLRYEELLAMTSSTREQIEFIADSLLNSKYGREQALKDGLEMLGIARQTLVHCTAAGTCIADLSEDEQIDMFHLLHVVTELEESQAHDKQWKEYLLQRDTYVAVDLGQETVDVTFALLTLHIESLRSLLLDCQGLPFPPVVKAAMELIHQAHAIGEHQVAKAIASWAQPFCVKERRMANFSNAGKDTPVPSSKTRYPRSELLSLREKWTLAPSSTLVLHDGWNDMKTRGILLC